MNMPGFTAVAALYKTSGHYQTDRNRINLPSQMVGTIYAAEVIEVHGCRPGHLQLGEGEDMVCIDPLDPFGTGGHEVDDGVPTGGGPDSVPTGGGGVPPKNRQKLPKPSRDLDKPERFSGCSPNQISSAAAKTCLDKVHQDLLNGVQPHFLRCTGSRQGTVAHPKMKCCLPTNGGGTVCDDLN